MLGIFLDSETNGLDWTKHVILEISFVIKDLENGKTIASYTAAICPSDEQWALSDPKSLAFTGITHFFLKSMGKEKSVVKKEMIEIFINNNIKRGNAVFICQNPTFDRIFFSQIIDVKTQEFLHLPYYWLDLASMYWCKKTLNGESLTDLSLSKDSIAKEYGISSEEKPHRSLGGVNHLITCYNSVVGFPKKDSQEYV